MNFAAHVTISKGLLTRFQQLWPYAPITTSENAVKVKFDFAEFTFHALR
jgi:hypothetical protein